MEAINNSSESSEQTERLAKLDEVLSKAEQDVAVQESHGKNSKPGWWEKNAGKVRKAVLVTVLSMGSLVAAGCDKHSSGPEKTGQETSKTETVGHHTEQEEKTALHHAFQMIAGNEIDRMPNGDLVLHVGGSDYYELDNSALQTLLKVTDSYLDRTARLESSNSPQKGAERITFDKSLKMVIMDEITNLGKKVSITDLPNNLREAERARQQAQKEMAN
jgi:hypothetical protein